MRNSLISILFIGLLAGACQKEEGNDNFSKVLDKSRYSVLMFFAPDCPLCLTYAKPLNDMAERYPDIRFIAVHSGTYYDAHEIQMFAEETKLDADFYRDYDYEVANKFGATITPEFLLVDSSGHVYYQGLMDDRMDELGVYKQQWGNHYLKDAIEAVIDGKEPEIKKTEPIGCVLEY